MEITRDIFNNLKAWKESKRRKPLVMQGARQVGKSWALRKFGEDCFEKLAYFNFDTMPELKEDFKRSKRPADIIKVLEMTSGMSIQPDTTLIVFDEVQECNEALNSLKYFCEDARDYAIACAGSLLGVALNRQGASFPVGKVDVMTLYPLSFSEYLRAIDSRLHSSYMMIDGSMPVPEVLHGRLIEAYKAYLALGGMPEAVSDFADNREWQAVQTIQQNILKSYSLDFSKHINNKDIPRVFQVWNSLQDQLAKEDRKFRYADIQKGARAREYESAIEWLCLAGIVQRVNMIETPRLPLSAYSKSNAFKLYLNDVGLLCSKFSLTAQSAISGNRLFTEFKGILSENYVLQTLRRQFGDSIFYWTSGNTAELEFVLQMDNEIVPVEVKSENNVKAKSLSIYRKTYSPSLSLRFSTRNIRKDDDLLNLPLYLADRISEIYGMTSVFQ